MNTLIAPDNLLCKLPFYIPDYADEPGSFGYVRKYDVHTGVDIYLPEGTPVFALEEGVVVWSGQFTGAAVDSAWWDDTWAVAIQSQNRILVYGELYRHEIPQVGSRIGGNWLIGYVKKVSRVPKGRPMSMLHIEEYDQTIPFVEPVVWNKGEPMPEGLCNPTPFLRMSLASYRTL